MKRSEVKTLLLAFLFVCSSFAQGAKSSPNTAPSEKIDAAALLRDIVGNVPKTTKELMGMLLIRRADGSQLKVPIKWMIRPMEGRWLDIYQTPDKFEIPQEVLIIDHQNGTNHYDYKRGGVAVTEVTTNVFIPFAMSDFYVGDFGLEFLHWPNPKHVKTEMKKGRPCYVIETVNPHPGKNAYARVRSWIDTENGGLIRAQAFTDDGSLLKEFEIKDIKRVEGHWQLKAVSIRNEQTDTNTRLEFDLEIKN
jgi:hypothetical protein